MKPGLAEMKNAVIVPHIASASKVMFTRIHISRWSDLPDCNFFSSCLCSGLVREWQR